MDLLIDWKRFEFSLQGETVSMELYPLDQRSVFLLMKMNPESGENSQVEVMETIFETNVRDIQGVTVNGQPIAPKDMANYSQLMRLSGQVMAKLTEISHLTDVEAKN